MLEKWLLLDIESTVSNYEKENASFHKEDQCPACRPEARGLATAVYVFLSRKMDPNNVLPVTSKMIKLMVEVEALRGHAFSHLDFQNLWVEAEKAVTQALNGEEIDLGPLLEASDLAQKHVHYHFSDVDHRFSL